MPESGAFPLIAGPCVAESEELVLGMADAVASIAEALGLPAIFKSSFDKANRSAGESFARARHGRGRCAFRRKRGG